MAKKITVALLNDNGVCCRLDGEQYSDANLRKLFKGEKSITLPEVLNKHIPAVDKVWVANLPGVLTKKQEDAWDKLKFARWGREAEPLYGGNEARQQIKELRKVLKNG